MGYMLTGRHIPAAKALEYGLVNEVAPLAEPAASTRSEQASNGLVREHVRRRLAARRRIH